MNMKTVRPFNADEMRVRASERIHGMFKGAPVIVIKYKNTFAEGYCQYRDGVTAFFTVWYRDLLPEGNDESDISPHEKAIRYINSIKKAPWA